MTDKTTALKKSIQKLTTLCLVLFLSATAYTQTLPHTEDFEDPASSDWNGTGWTLDGNTASTDASGGDVYLVGPTFDFSALMEVPVFTFQYSSLINDVLIVQVDVNDGNGWNDIEVLLAQPQIDFGEVNPLNNLNYDAILGEANVQFRFKALQGNVINLDDIDISEAPETYDVMYTYDAAGNRNSRSLITVNFVSNEEGLEELEKELEMPLADTNEDPIFSNTSISQSDFSVFPNPTQQYVNVNTSLQGNSFEMKLLDSSGRVVQSRTLNGKQTQFDLSGNIAGVYYLAIFSNTERLVYKVIKE